MQELDEWCLYPVMLTLNFMNASIKRHLYWGNWMVMTMTVVFYLILESWCFKNNTIFRWWFLTKCYLQILLNLMSYWLLVSFFYVCVLHSSLNSDHLNYWKKLIYAILIRGTQFKQYTLALKVGEILIIRVFLIINYTFKITCFLNQFLI